ncbi:MAG: hypothetical protein JSV64_05765 [Candidatus Bathyarchaeota archaeon]|nr:MAG: hypothetical protein JSV64_05765 [Candidatus Bathyarchaeota archaeon]
MGKKEASSHEGILIALNESMEVIFGKRTVEAIYYYLEKKFLLKLEDIPRKSVAFTEAIAEMFGVEGASLIETMLVRDLSERFALKGTKEGLSTLSDCMSVLGFSGSQKCVAREKTE